MPDDLVDEIDDRRHSKTDRSEWIRDAILARLAAEDADEWEEPEKRYSTDDGADPAAATN